MNRHLQPIGSPALPQGFYPMAVGTEPTGDYSRLNARDILNIFLRHSRLILAVMLIVTSIVLVRGMLAKPEYVAKAVAKIDLVPSAGANTVAPPEREMRLDTQARQMGSQAFAEMIVRDLGLHRNASFLERKPLAGPLTPAQEKSEVSRAAAKLKASAEVKRQSQTQLVEVTVSTRSPDLSARIADQYLSGLQEWDNDARQARREQALGSLGPQMQKADAELRAAEKTVADARASYRMLPGAGSEMDLQQINQIANEYVSASGQGAGARSRAGGVAASGIGGVTLDQQTSPLLASQQRRFDELTRRKAELSVTYGANYPEMKTVEAELAQLNRDMSAEQQRARNAAFAAASANAARETQIARSEAAGASARAGTIGGYLRDVTSRAYANNQNKVALAQLERDLKVKRDAFEALSSRFQQVVNNQGAGGIIATPLSLASVPRAPTNLSLRRSLTAALIGSLVLGCLLAFAKEMIDNKLRSSAQIRRRFGLPTFAMLPRVDRDLLAAPGDNPVVRSPRSIFAETSRALYTDVIHLHDRSGSQVVAVTSALPGEGKSTVALSLAAASAMSGRRAILVDLDLRRHGMIQEMQRDSGGPDLLDYLARREPVSGLLPPAEAHAGKLSEEKGPFPTILSVHHPVADPGALIASPQLGELVQDLRRQFDFIVINAPPLLAVRDAKTLSHIADDTLMVVRWGETTAEEAEAAIETLDRPPAGIVFNDVDYAEHARRRYSDPIQFVARARDYYEDAGKLVEPGPLGRLIEKFRARFRPRSAWS